MSGIPTSEVLYRAADLIEERGWTTGNFGWTARTSGPLCLEGAIAAAATIPAGGVPYDERLFFYDLSELTACPASIAVATYLETEQGPGQSWRYNDQANRTAEEVIATLRAAAVIEAAKENTEAREQVSL